ncbi:uncharacterized protein PHALS_14890, partial [Plasmopara halstedii]
MQVIARTKLVSNRRHMEIFLSSCNGNPLAKSLCGYIFKPYCQKLLHKGGCFRYRELFSGAQKQKQRKRGRQYVGDGQKNYNPTVIAASANSGAGGSRSTCKSAI